MKKNLTLMTDLYELTMAQTYFDEGKKDEIGYFDVFFRKNPFNGGYTLSGGLIEIIDFINNFHFDEDDINYLRSLNLFSEEFLDYLKNYRFDGSIYGVPDGTMIFPNEPVFTIKAPLVLAQYIETALLAAFNGESLVCTAAKRITNEAKGIPVMEFGARRARGIESSVYSSLYGYIGGCVSTSNVLTGRLFDIPVSGTMAHSLVEESDSEYEAFLGYAKSNPNNCIFLVDTYDTLRSGIPNAIRVAKEYLIPNGYKFKGIRIDSGNLTYLSKKARELLDKEGFYDTKICLSNGLNEYTISGMINDGAVIDSIGCGDNIAASKERIGGVYKLVAIEKDDKIISKIKVSEDEVKTINPGYKKVYRFYDKESGYALGDVIVMHDEIIPTDHYTLVHPTDRWKQKDISNYEVRELLIPIYENGKQVYIVPSVKESREYANREFNSIYPEMTTINNPEEYYVDLSNELYETKQSMIKTLTKRR